MLPHGNRAVFNFVVLVGRFIYLANCRADGLTKYKEDKVKPLFDGPTPKPLYVTEYYKKREEISGQDFFS